MTSVSEIGSNIVAHHAARSIQRQLASKARELATRWREALECKLTADESKALIGATHAFLVALQDAGEINDAVRRIIMGEDFQGLVAQVIMKIAHMMPSARVPGVQACAPSGTSIV